jgi:hypothetical protein
MVRSWGVGRTVKSVALVPVPLAFVTVIGPVLAPVGTTAVIWVEELTVKLVEATPPNFTEVVPVKFVPTIVTEVPAGPLVGENEVIVGEPAGVTVKFDELVAVPPGVVRLILPVCAPEGTTAVIWVFELTVKVVALVFLNFTSVAPVRLVPVMTTEVPTGPLIGTKEVIVGAGTVVTVKFTALVAVPSGVVTLIFPVVAPFGTVAVIWLSEFTVKAAEVAPNFTELAPVNPVPLIVTRVPTGPLVGEKPVMVGGVGPVTVKSWALVAVPEGVVTAIFPVVAPEGTIAVSWVPEGFHENVVALVTLNFTDVVPTKLDPLIVTEDPTGPLVGEKPVMLGAHEEPTVKSSRLVAEPSGLTTRILPVVAPVGTVAVMRLGELMVNPAAIPLKSTDVTPWKWFPPMATLVPTGPQAGEKPVISGGGAACAAGAARATSTVATARLRARRRPIGGLRALIAPPHVRCASSPALSVPQEGSQRIGQKDEMKTADVLFRFLDRGIRACEKAPAASFRSGGSCSCLSLRHTCRLQSQPMEAATWTAKRVALLRPCS